MEDLKGAMTAMQAAIAAIEYYLPERTVTTDNLSAEFPEWSVSKIDTLKQCPKKFSFNYLHKVKIDRPISKALLIGKPTINSQPSPFPVAINMMGLHKRRWPPLIKMDEAVKAKVERLFGC